MIDDFYAAKFDDDGNVRPGWNFNAWILDRSADIPKTGSPDLAAFAWRAA
jgi:hypothetical protein